MILLTAGFFYMQWPTHQRAPDEPNYVSATLDNGFTVVWEEQPVQQQAESPEVWGLTRKGMSFLVQTDVLEGSFEQLVRDMADSDRALVAGAEQEPISITDSVASYAFFDAESRIQKHRIYLQGDQWVKVSVLYKPSMESRVKRADEFLAKAQF